MRLFLCRLQRDKRLPEENKAAYQTRHSTHNNLHNWRPKFSNSPSMLPVAQCCYCNDELAWRLQYFEKLAMHPDWHRMELELRKMHSLNKGNFFAPVLPKWGSPKVGVIAKRWWITKFRGYFHPPIDHYTGTDICFVAQQTSTIKNANFWKILVAKICTYVCLLQFLFSLLVNDFREPEENCEFSVERW